MPAILTDKMGAPNVHRQEGMKTMKISVVV